MGTERQIRAQIRDRPEIHGGRRHSLFQSGPRVLPLFPAVDSSKGLISEFFEWFGDLGIFFWQVMRAAVTPPFEFRELFRQLDEIGSKSLPLVALAGAATGVVLSLEARYSLTRFGAKSLLPAAIVFSVIHETGPIITGLVVSGRVGAGIGAELASMKVTEQIDAIEASAVNPYRLLAATRILACILMLPLLTLAADACGLFMGWVAQALVEPLSFHQFINSGFNGAEFQRFPAAHVQDRCVWPDHRADRVLSGNAHTGRRCGRGPCGHEFGSLVLAVRDPGRCRAGETHPHIFPVSIDRSGRETNMDTIDQFAMNRPTRSEDSRGRRRCPAVAVEDLHKSFGGQKVLNGISLTVKRGETLAVLGRSGTGKSVLLRLIIGLEKPDAGSVRIHGQDIAGLALDQLGEIRKKMGFLFQHAALYDSLTVEQNVAFPLQHHRKEMSKSGAAATGSGNCWRK